ncbi:hypothetical protein DVB69_16040 [Sporosarcina sp. BI001-red]|nr:hypothetical protein DVB69_16040 [Sporosarcina sp. BI001-red]
MKDTFAAGIPVVNASQGEAHKLNVGFDWSRAHLTQPVSDKTVRLRALFVIQIERLHCFSAVK